MQQRHKTTKEQRHNKQTTQTEIQIEPKGTQNMKETTI